MQEKFMPFQNQRRNVESMPKSMLRHGVYAVIQGTAWNPCQNPYRGLESMPCHSYKKSRHAMPWVKNPRHALPEKFMPCHTMPKSMPKPMPCHAKIHTTHRIHTKIHTISMAWLKKFTTCLDMGKKSTPCLARKIYATQRQNPCHGMESMPKSIPRHRTHTKIHATTWYICQNPCHCMDAIPKSMLRHRIHAKIHATTWDFCQNPCHLWESHAMPFHAMRKIFMIFHDKKKSHHAKSDATPCQNQYHDM